MTVHICRGVGVQYRAMVRRPGCRNWYPAGPWRKSRDTAAREMLKAFTRTDQYKRGAVWMIADYYDPTSVLEMKRP